MLQFTCAGVGSDRLLQGLVLRVGGGSAEEEQFSGNGQCKNGQWFLSAFPYQIFTSFLGFVVVRRSAGGRARRRARRMTCA